MTKNGTFTNGERRVQKVNKVVEPIGEAKPDGQIIIDMMYKLGYQQPTGKEYKANLILEEIAEVIPFMKGISWENLGENGLQWPVNEKISVHQKPIQISVLYSGFFPYHSFSVLLMLTFASITFPIVLTIL